MCAMALAEKFASRHHLKNYCSERKPSSMTRILDPQVANVNLSGAAAN